MAALTARRGDPVKLDVALKEPATLEPLNLTGRTVWFTVKKDLPKNPTQDLDDATAMLKAFYVHGGAALYLSTDNPTTGVLKLRIPSSVTTTWVADTFRYDIQVTDGADTVTYDEGTFTVALDLTRRITTP